MQKQESRNDRLPFITAANLFGNELELYGDIEWVECDVSQECMIQQEREYNKHIGAVLPDNSEEVRCRNLKDDLWDGSWVPGKELMLADRPWEFTSSSTAKALATGSERDRPWCRSPEKLFCATDFSVQQLLHRSGNCRNVFEFFISTHFSSHVL
ncbi:MAG: hypothetical protein ACYCOU_02460 [Sulfobacillus sp.]